ncbi:MAG: LPS-assembly protein LptD, partial [Alistipes sp.]|nr:LPS-assembly protein LptD [Alistipes sp.]
MAIAAQVVFGAAFSEARIEFAPPSPATLSASDSIKPTVSKEPNTKITPEELGGETTRQRRRMGTLTRVDSSAINLPDSATRARRDSMRRASGDTISVFTNDSARVKKGGSFLEDIISGKNTDSLVYDVKNKLVYIYNEGDVTYQNMNLKADFMRVNMDTKEIYAYGKPDSVDGKLTSTHPVFTEGQSSYTMDTITYNISSKKAKIKGVATQEGDGWLVGGSIKKMADNTINIQHGKYTTCDHTDHPHFYLAMTKAKVIPGKKVITGPAYLVMEDVPIYFLGIPEGFFPINMGPKSGLLMPSFGEDSKGFFIRDLGYYFKLGDHADLAIRGGIYTLGSWELSAASRYIKRYKFSGNLSANFASVKYGEKGEPDYIKQNNFRIQWTHTQDPKANPGSTFSASVNFATSGYNRYSATSLNDILSTQTNSTISYSKNWAGTPLSLSMNLAVSQNSQTKAIQVTLPTIAFNVSRIYPFKRKEAVGKQRWYEKISMSYSAKMTNSVQAKESDIFTAETLKNMRNGIQHTIPVQVQFNLFNFINVTPNINYTERWYFRRDRQQWNPETNAVDKLDPEYGFYRLYNYNAGISLSTILYGQWQVREKYKDFKLQALRHTITPSLSMSYAPDFSNQKYGYYETI